MKTLTLKQLKKMKPRTIFASGFFNDSPYGVNMANTGRLLRWLAVRGGIHDWAIYCHFSDYSDDYIKNSGDKINSKSNIKKLVPCDDEAFEMYRF